MNPKRVESYNQIKMCMCVEYGGYMVASLILLCSLKTYLSFELGIIFARKHRLSYSSHFFRWASKYPSF